MPGFDMYDAFFTGAAAALIAIIAVAIYHRKKNGKAIDLKKMLNEQTVVSTLDVGTITEMCKSLKSKYSGEECSAAVMTLEKWSAKGVKLPKDMEVKKYVVLIFTDKNKREIKETKLINFDKMSDDMKQLMALNNDLIVIEI